MVVLGGPIDATYLCGFCAKGSRLRHRLRRARTAPSQTSCRYCGEREDVAEYYVRRAAPIGGYIGYASTKSVRGRLPYDFPCELCGKNIWERDTVVRVRRGKFPYEGLVHARCVQKGRG